MATKDVLTKTLASEDEQLQAEEAIITKLARDEQVTPAELRFIHCRCLEYREVEKRVNARRSVLRHQEIAGDAQYRANLQQQLADAERALETDAPDIEAELQRLQKQLKELQDAVKMKAGELDRADNAVENLRKCAPQHIRQESDSLRGYIKRHFADVETMEGRLKSIDSQLQVTDRRQRLLTLGMLPMNHPCYPYQDDGSRRLKNVASDQVWSNYCDEIRREREELQPVYEQRRAEREARLAEGAKLLDFYVR